MRAGSFEAREEDILQALKLAQCEEILQKFSLDSKDLSANGAFGSIENKQEFKDALINAQNKANISHVGLKGIIGYRFGDGLSFKPFVGVDSGMYAQGGRKRAGLL